MPDDAAFTFGGQRGQDQRGARAQVGDLDFGALQRRGPWNTAVCGVEDVDLGAHRLQARV